MLPDNSGIFTFRKERIHGLFGFFESEEGFMKLLHFSVVTGNPEKGGCLFHTLQRNEA